MVPPGIYSGFFARLIRLLTRQAQLGDRAAVALRRGQNDHYKIYAVNILKRYGNEKDFLTHDFSAVVSAKTA